MPRSSRAFRAAVVQRVVDGEDQAAVADERGIKRATVRSWMHRARLKTEARLEWVRGARQRHAGQNLDAIVDYMRRPSWVAAVVADQRARHVINDALCEFDEAYPGQF